MLKAAEKLGKPFAVARIDFYEIKGKPYFGEITLTPDAGNTTYLTDAAQIQIGKMIDEFVFLLFCILLDSFSCFSLILILPIKPL